MKLDLESWKSVGERIVSELESEAGDCAQYAPLHPPLMSEFLSTRASEIRQLIDAVVQAAQHDAC